MSDVHLSVRPRAAISDAVCAWVHAHHESEIVAAGDWFDFSSVTEGDAGATWRRLCTANPEVIAALQRHTAEGGRLTLVAGNHDAPLTAASADVVATFGGPERCAVEPWFVRRGGVHVEHGHLWDRDNAPLHPLADWSPATEPLGVALMRRVVAKRGVLDFAHDHDTTPVQGVVRAFELYQARAPLILAQYFATAGHLCLEAGRRRKLQAMEAETLGRARLVRHAARVGVDAARLQSVISGAPHPTHLRFKDTFLRLYLDRIIAGIVAGASASAAAVLGGAPLALVGLGVSSLYLAGTMRAGQRYVDPARALREAAPLVADALDASCVVFGHAHAPEQAERYVNLGSFAYCPDRPFAAIGSDGSVKLRYWGRPENP